MHPEEEVQFCELPLQMAGIGTFSVCTGHRPGGGRGRVSCPGLSWGGSEPLLRMAPSSPIGRGNETQENSQAVREGGNHPVSGLGVARFLGARNTTATRGGERSGDPGPDGGRAESRCSFPQEDLLLHASISARDRSSRRASKLSSGEEAGSGEAQRRAIRDGSHSGSPHGIVL